MVLFDAVCAPGWTDHKRQARHSAVDARHHRQRQSLLWKKRAVALTHQVCARVRVCVCVFAHVSAHVYVCVCVYVSVCLCACVHPPSLFRVCCIVLPVINLLCFGFRFRFLFWFDFLFFWPDHAHLNSGASQNPARTPLAQPVLHSRRGARTQWLAQHAPVSVPKGTTVVVSTPPTLG